MAKRTFVSKRALKLVFYGAAAVVGVFLAISTAKKKGMILKKSGQKIIKKTKLNLKAIKDKLNKRQIQMIKLFDKEDKITNEMLQNVIEGVTERTIRRDLNFLEEKGYIKKIGKTKGSYYTLK
jgi:predicted HTH transcriptional regulator